MKCCPGCGGKVLFCNGTKDFGYYVKAGFSGSLRDTLGRTFCFRDGERIACEQDDDKKKKRPGDDGKEVPPETEEERPEDPEAEDSEDRILSFPLEAGFVPREPTGAIECDWYVLGNEVKGLSWYAIPSLDRLNRELRSGRRLDRSDYANFRALYQSGVGFSGVGCIGLDLRFSPEVTEAYLNTYATAAQNGTPLALKGFTPLVEGTEAMFAGNLRLVIKFANAVRVGEDCVLDDGCPVAVTGIDETSYGWDVWMETLDAEANGGEDAEPSDDGGELPGESDGPVDDQRGGDAAVRESGRLPGGDPAGDDE